MSALLQRLQSELQHARDAGTYKRLSPLESAPSARVRCADGRERLLLSSNDYQGLANHPFVREAAKKAIDQYGAGTASVRFICGSLAVHAVLEEKIAAFLGTESALTFSSAWAANTGLIPSLLAPGEVVISDALNHASIIDGCRAVAKGVLREVYPHGDLAALEAILQRHAGLPGRVVITDGVFSMEGDLAPLDRITALCEQYDALLVLDDSHGVGVVGATGRGTAEFFGVLNRVAIHVGTLGKALGGGAGGYVAGPACVIETLIQRSRPHLFSNAIPASVAASSIAALSILEREPGRTAELASKVQFFRDALRDRQITPLDGDSALVPVILGTTARAIAVAKEMFERGVMVTGFGFPVVPEGHARLRFQVSNAHSREDLEQAADVLAEVLRSAASA